MRLLLTTLLLVIVTLTPVPAAQAAGRGVAPSALDGEVNAGPSKARLAPRHRKRAPRHTARRITRHRTVKAKAKAPAHRAPATRAVVGDLTLV